MSGICSVLFVCTGNSCRSVMAKALLQKRLKELGKEHISVRSAGTSAIDGFTPTNETITVMEKEGIDVASFKSQRISPEIIKDADLILAMEGIHKDYVLKAVPEARSRTYLLKEFKAESGTNYPDDPNIPDPIGKSIDYYKLSLAVIKDEIERIVKFL